MSTHKLPELLLYMHNNSISPIVEAASVYIDPTASTKVDIKEYIDNQITLLRNQISASIEEAISNIINEKINEILPNILTEMINNESSGLVSKLANSILEQAVELDETIYLFPNSTETTLEELLTNIEEGVINNVENIIRKHLGFQNYNSSYVPSVLPTDAPYYFSYSDIKDVVREDLGMPEDITITVINNNIDQLDETVESLNTDLSSLSSAALTTSSLNTYLKLDNTYSSTNGIMTYISTKLASKLHTDSEIKELVRGDLGIGTGNQTISNRLDTLEAATTAESIKTLLGWTDEDIEQDRTITNKILDVLDIDSDTFDGKITSYVYNENLSAIKSLVRVDLGVATSGTINLQNAIDSKTTLSEVRTSLGITTGTISLYIPSIVVSITDTIDDKVTEAVSTTLNPDSEDSIVPELITSLSESDEFLTAFKEHLLTIDTAEVTELISNQLSDILEEVTGLSTDVSNNNTSIANIQSSINTLNTAFNSYETLTSDVTALNNWKTTATPLLNTINLQVLTLNNNCILKGHALDDVSSTLYNYETSLKLVVMPYDSDTKDEAIPIPPEIWEPELTNPDN